MSLNILIVLSLCLFSIGVLGVLTRRNILIIYMCLELMLNGINLALVSFSRYNNSIDGALFVFFIIAIAAAEVAVGLAIIVALFRLKKTVMTQDLKQLKL